MIGWSEYLRFCLLSENLNQAFIFKLLLGLQVRVMKLRPRARKHMRFSEDDFGRDRLSEMPDDVIVHILSFMPTGDAVRTVVLRRFGNLWTLVPTLDFNLEHLIDYFNKDKDNFVWEPDDIQRFNCFVGNVLMLHKGLSIDKFHLSLFMPYGHDDNVQNNDDIELWLRFGLDRQAKEIEFRAFHDFDVYTGLSYFKSQYLVTLKLINCKIGPQLTVRLGSLKKLVFDYCSVCEEAFQAFIHGCPSLQELCLFQASVDLHDISFSAPNIVKLSLSLDDMSFYHPRPFNCPNLKILDFAISFWLPDFIDLSSVRDVNISSFKIDESWDENCELFKLFMGKIEAAENFKFSYRSTERFLDAIQSLSLMIQNRWKCLVLELQRLHKSCLLGINQLMRNSGHLEELVIYTKDCSCTDVLSSEPLSSCVMTQLKTINLHGYAKSWNRQLRLVEFLLESSPALEKLVIAPIEYRLEAADELEFVKRVSSFRRASTSARVVFA